MTKAEYLDFCRSIPGATVDQPFEEDFETYIARHCDNRKWFSAVLWHENRVLINLKCDPIEGEFLKSVYAGIVTAYHMNKTHWITVYPDSDVPDELLKQLTMNSFRLTEKKRKNATKAREGT